MKKIGFVVLLPGLILALAGGQAASAQAPGAVPGNPPGVTPANSVGRLPGMISSFRRDSLRLMPLPAMSLRNPLLFQFYDAKGQEGRKGWEGWKGLDGYGSLLPAGDSVRIMPPDNMACLVPDLTKLEKMPVMKLRNRRPVDPMPDAMPRAGYRVPFTPQKAVLPQ